MSEVDQMVNTTNTTATEKEAPGAVELAIGILLTLCGAVTLALSMVHIVLSVQPENDKN